MTDPIISPWFFYLLGLFEVLKIISIVFMVIGLLGLCICLPTWLYYKYAGVNEEDEEAGWKRGLKLSIPVLIISAFFTLVVPSKKTMIF